MWIFQPGFWGEFFDVNFWQWISWGWIFEGALFIGKHRTKKFDPRIRPQNSGLKNSYPRLRPQIRVHEVQNPLCGNLPLTQTVLGHLLKWLQIADPKSQESPQVAARVLCWVGTASGWAAECTKIAHRCSLAIFTADGRIAGNSAARTIFTHFLRRRDRG